MFLEIKNKDKKRNLFISKGFMLLKIKKQYGLKKLMKKKSQITFLVLIVFILITPFFNLDENRVNAYNLLDLNTSLINKIDLNRIYNITEHLSSFTTRETGTLQCNLAANDIQTILNVNYNVTDSFFENFEYNQTICFNVIGRINGTNIADQIIIICAHYDSISSFGQAPGANDNAVAVAACMEVMGIIQNNVLLNRTLLFIAYAGEEQAFIGSQAWINQHKNELSQVIAVINLDMIGFGSHIAIIKNSQSEWLADTIISASSAVNVTFMKSNSPYPENTRFDHESFWVVNVPSVTLFEAGAIYPYYHTSDDTIDRISFPLVEKFVQTTLLSILHLGVVNFQHNGSFSAVIIASSIGFAILIPLLIFKRFK